MTINVSDGPRVPGHFDPEPYWEDRLGARPSLLEVGYSSLGTRYNEWLYKLRRRGLRRQLAGLNLDMSRLNVLDVGSGSGFYIDFWRETGAGSVSGSDLTEASVSYLRSRFPLNTFHKLDIGGELSPALGPAYDLISAFDVLFHIVDDTRFDRAISNISHLLREGGVFVFTDSFLHHETERSSHQVSRSLVEVECALARAGLEILVRRPVFVVMNQPLDTQSRVLRFLWRLAMYPVMKSGALGALWGAALYPFDVILTRVLAESPTTEIMICRKVAQI